MKNITDIICENDNWSYAIIRAHMQEGDIMFKDIMVLKTYISEEDAINELERNRKALKNTEDFNQKNKCIGFYRCVENSDGSNLEFWVVKPKVWVQKFKYYNNQLKTLQYN